MPSFADAYSESQRWDVAFYAMTLRVEFAPRRPTAGQVFTLDELAASSNGELLARLRAKQPISSLTIKCERDLQAPTQTTCFTSSTPRAITIPRRDLRA